MISINMNALKRVLNSNMLPDPSTYPRDTYIVALMSVEDSLNMQQKGPHTGTLVKEEFVQQQLVLQKVEYRINGVTRFEWELRVS